ncbi:amidohydrolase family protein [Frankia sp. CNm7]|uniref:Amidohydrolase family protein n=1 Tax=Frankia nepalensis TaxID=1836974 RepID=A0A937REJ1_9ACTN|nr:amidohydrolase family protein [Frankia nepalensis]MBL7496670.1 amidohydrolase family protein [Frankia nepalensis]MBL7510688.1 amidohydrolase family protein [Frankia nepalensis]MBL7516679.1 amidohydrolase family protein [Frankia nepalensis]MBL7627409.1 amidohydrolase family protein [Frankia nepalensis]
MTHEQVKYHLPSRLHEAYDKASGDYEARMNRGAGAANRAGAKGGQASSASNAVFGRKAYYDPVARLEDMDTDGVEAEVLYSEVSAFRYLASVEGGVDETVQAFNDALADFASTDPNRLIVSYQIPIHDIDLAVREVQRVAAKGGKSLQMPVFPSEFKLPEYFDERYAPLFSAIEETGLPICFHIGLNTNLADLFMRDPTPNKGIAVPLVPLMTAEALGMIIMGGVLERHPRLKVVFVEPGLAWVAWWLETVDDMVRRQGYKFPAIKEMPSEYYYRNVFLTFIDESVGLQRVRDLLGVNNIIWSTDFPHPVTSWPNSRAVVDKIFTGIPAEERKAMVSGNAARVWNL